jgi:hypothetical protein
MTTAKQIKTLVTPLLERHPDLVLANHCTLRFQPTGHVAREILINRTSVPDLFKLDWFLSESFHPGDIRGHTFGRCSSGIYRSEPRVSGWLWSDPTMAEDFVMSCEREAIPVLRPLDTDRKRLEFARDRPESQFRYPPEWRLITAIALGNLDDARAIWTGVKAYYAAGHAFADPYFQPSYDRISRMGEPLMADDRRALTDLLHAWETENAVGNKLAALRTPGPFPIEEAGLHFEEALADDTR